MDYKNYSNGGLKLCDYVTLNLKDASAPVDGVYSWTVPTGSYYSDRRSQVCTVEISGGVLATSSASDDVLLIQYQNGGFNHFCSGKVRPLIGTWSDLDNRATGVGEILVNARPQQISLKIQKVDRDNSSGILSGSITLKYKYYNSIQSKEQLHSEYTPIISL